MTQFKLSEWKLSPVSNAVLMGLLGPLHLVFLAQQSKNTYHVNLL